MKTLIMFLIIVFFVQIAIGIFVYMSLCIVFVKQGTRKIVERFGVYRKTLKEGIHIIWRPFDKIAPVPWDILSISQRDAVNEELAGVDADLEYPLNNKGRVDKNAKGTYVPSNNGKDYTPADVKKYNELRDLEIEALVRNDMIKCLGKVYEDVGLVFDASSFDLNAVCKNATNESADDVIKAIIFAENRVAKLEQKYRQLGIVPSEELKATINYRYAVRNNVDYYPRHQDPRASQKKRKFTKYALKEHEKLDYLDLRERYIDSEAHKDYDSQEVITKDNASIKVNTIIFFYITDCFMYYYGAEEPERAMALLTISTLRNTIASLTLEEALQSRIEINKILRETLDAATNTWGIKVSRVEIKEFLLEDELKDAMNTILISERKKRAAILLAEGEARGIELTRAAQAQGYKLIKESGITEEVLRIRECEALEKVADGKATKIFLPNNMSNVVTNAHVFADALEDKKQEVKEQEAAIKTADVIDSIEEK